VTHRICTGKHGRSPTLAILAVCVFLMLASCAAPGVVSIPGADGESHTPLQGKDGDVVVLVFSSPDCPIANAIAPEIERLHRQTAAGGGRFYLVHAREDVGPERARQHAASYSITAPILLDGGHRLVDPMEATVTPEIVVVRLDGQGGWSRVYQGRINNLYASLGNRRDRATEHYARDAVMVALDGGTVEQPYIPPLGCYLETRR
jgi:hypothetical protein